MNGECTNGVVDFEAFEQFGTAEDDQTGDRTNHNRFHVGHTVRQSGDTHQTGEDAVQGHTQVRFFVHDPGDQHSEHSTSSSGQSRVNGNQHHSVQVVITGDGELRTGVKAVPTDEQDKHTQSSKGHVVTRHGGLFGAKTTNTWTEYDRTSQTSETTHSVYEDRSGEVIEAHAVQPATAPFPGTGDRVDDPSQEHGVNQVGAEFHTTGNCTGNDGRGGSGEGSLEQEVDLYVQRATGDFFNRSSFGTGNTTITDETIEFTRVHDAVTNEEVQKNPKREVHHVLHQNVDGVFGVVQTGFQNGETSLHENNENRSQQQEEVVDHVIVNVGGIHFLAKGHSACHQSSHHGEQEFFTHVFYP